MQNLSVNFTRKTFGMLNILHFIKKEAFCQKNLNKSICISTLGKWYSKKGYTGLVAKAFFLYFILQLRARVALAQSMVFSDA